LADALVLGASTERCRGSSPLSCIFAMEQKIHRRGRRGRRERNNLPQMGHDSTELVEVRFTQMKHRICFCFFLCVHLCPMAKNFFSMLSVVNKS
jgi:hypothetical protein